MVAKLGMYSSKRLYFDWQAAQPDESTRKLATWTEFKTLLRTCYKPTENLTLKNFHFRALTQEPQETFPAFCNRIQKEARHCQFKCKHDDCTAAETSVRDQIVIGTHEDSIREEALKKSWDLQTLRQEGMKMESAAKGGAEISSGTVNKLGKYSFTRIRSNKEKDETKTDTKELTCFNCG